MDDPYKSFITPVEFMEVRRHAFRVTDLTKFGLNCTEGETLAREDREIDTH